MIIQCTAIPEGKVLEGARLRIIVMDVHSASGREKKFEVASGNSRDLARCCW